MSEFLMSAANITTDGIPAIPSDLARSAARYNTFRAAFFARWHPERLEMLILTRLADTAQVHRVRSAGGGWSPVDWSADGSQLLCMEHVSIADRRLWLVDSVSGQRERVAISSDSETGAAGAARFSKDNRGIYFTSDHSAEFKRLCFYDLGVGRCEVVYEATWDVEDFSLSEDGHYVALLVNESGASGLVVLELASGQNVPLPTIPHGVILGVTWHRDNRHLALTLSSAQIPGDVFVLDGS